ncbi:RNA polymerase sigma factor [Winogradskyella vincentii]|uniref:RNA polymerase sigma factor n=1 Tax=Winogradskyella vincentii TaxID=2877122 RepID=A0ABS7Y1P9_9FLAO|nr:RNA polymerase sigma factor [Winogradskyella vincentii]MCA0153865.1 RNA polymerase sigma factor [Winogradskyella vincentii]
MKADQYTDEFLVKAFKAGDGMALATLVKRWHKLFCKKAYWLVRDKDVAKDIAQDSWTIIIDKIDKLKEPKHFKYWAYRIICNKSTDWLRAQTRKKRNKAEYEIVTQNNSIETPDNNNLKQVLLKEIEELPEGQKKVIRLFYIESYSLKQISEILDISTGTTKSRLFHAREKLKKSLKHRNYEN